MNNISFTEQTIKAIGTEVFKELAKNLEIIGKGNFEFTISLLCENQLKVNVAMYSSFERKALALNFLEK